MMTAAWWLDVLKYLREQVPGELARADRLRRGSAN